jgi:hypothetical protein
MHGGMWYVVSYCLVVSWNHGGMVVDGRSMMVVQGTMYYTRIVDVLTMYGKQQNHYS